METKGKIAGRQMSRRVLKMSGQTDRDRAADLMAGGANAFKDYMFFSDEQDRSSFPTDNLAAQCAFVIGHLPGCDTKHITAHECARPQEDPMKALIPCMNQQASTGSRAPSTCAACGFNMLKVAHVHGDPPTHSRFLPLLRSSLRSQVLTPRAPACRQPSHSIARRRRNII